MRKLLFHGGDLHRGKRKLERPLATDRSLHLVLKANQEIFPRRLEILDLLVSLAFRFEVRIYDVAFGPDHLHLRIKIPSREAYARFIRSLTGLVARKFGKGIWSQSPFTRIVPWGRAVQTLQRYFQKNRDESVGRISYEPRKDWYRNYR